VEESRINIFIWGVGVESTLADPRSQIL